MPLVPVPDLKRKFGLLRAYSPRTGWDALSRPFGAAAKTLQYWCDGNQTRAPDQLPPAALPVLISLFAELLPASRPDELRRLVLGPAAGLEAALRAGAAASFAALLAREARPDGARLIRLSSASGLVEIDDERDPAQAVRVPLGAWFRLDYDRQPGCSYAAALQGVAYGWAVLPCAVADAPGRVLSPGLADDGTPRFMRERRDAGLHRFVCLQAAEPFPPLLDEHRRETALLDKAGLETLAAFYDALPPARRACLLLPVLIVPDPAEADGGA